jgi:small subunit ribosomal protein S20
MATLSAAKRARQASSRSLKNRTIESRLRTLQKRARKTEGASADQIRAAISVIDKAANRRVIHRNAAIRRKARLNRMLAAAGK